MFGNHGFLRKKGNEIFINMLSEPKLAEIGRIHGTDKVDQNHTFNNLSYLDIYERYFEKIKDRDVSILEIGVRAGESLRTWKSYFKKGEIFGIDIDPTCKQLEEKRVNIEIGSQSDINFLQTCFGKDREFDIIIDDGSHVNSFTITSFEYLFNNRLKRGGIYIIEDLACSYLKLETDYNVSQKWPGMKHNDPDMSLDNNRKDMDNFFLEKIKELDHLRGNILCIHFWAMTCVIIKI